MSNRHYFCAAAVAVLAAASCSAPAFAQTEPASPARLDEIVVTARKTTENLQKAPASIVAVSGGDLAKRGIADAQSLEKVLPSFNLRTQGPITQVFIRGVGTRTDTPNFAAASAFVFNGIIVPRYGTFGLVFDLGNVQAISGPQGTLYGGSAAGGALNVNSAQPTHDYSGSGFVDGGNYSAVHASVTQNIPLGDKVSIRGSLDYNNRDSYYNAGFNSQDSLAGRFSLLAKPTDDVTALFFYQGAHDNSKPITTFSTNPLSFPSDPYRTLLTGPLGNPVNASLDRQDNDFAVYGANIDWRVGGNTFTYIPGFVKFTTDYQYFSGAAGNQLQVYDHENQQSHELRWNRTQGVFQLSAGAFYLHDKTVFNDSLYRPTSATTFARTLLNTTNQTNESSAVYGQVVFSATDKLRFTGGARESRDEIDAQGLGASSVPFHFSRSQDHADYKAGVDYDLAPDVLIYANAQTGYIPFGYNPDVTPAAVIPESKLLALSGGVKSRFFDRRLEINAEGYHYDYKNFQAISFINATGLSTVLNAQQATIYGLDLSARAVLPYDTTFNAGMVLQKARYDEFSGIGYNYNGNKLQNAPALVINAGLQHTIVLGNHGSLVGEANTRYESSRYGNFNNFNTTLQKANTKTDLSLTYTVPNNRWSVQAYVHNVENVATYNSLSAGATTHAPSSGFLMAPRTYGVRVSANWF